MVMAAGLGDQQSREEAAKQRKDNAARREEAEKAQQDQEKLIALLMSDPQGFLFGNLLKLVEMNTGLGFKKLKYHGLSPSSIYPASSLMSTLVNPPEIDTFISATPAMLGILTPRIEFFVVTNRNKTYDSQPIRFSDHASGERMITLAKAKGGDEKAQTEIFKANSDARDVGIREFTWMFDNKHEGDKTLKASLTMFFGSALELMNEQSLSFIFNNVNDPSDIIKASTDNKVSLEQVTERFKTLKAKPIGSYSKSANDPKADDVDGFRQIKVNVGWSRPERLDDNVLAKLSSEELKEFYEAVSATQKTILLNLTQYKLNFGQEGQVELTIDYVGSLDSVLADPDLSDIFLRTSTDNKNAVQTIPVAAVYREGAIQSWTFGLFGSRNPDEATDLERNTFGYTPSTEVGEFGAQGKLIGHLGKQLQKAKKNGIKAIGGNPGVRVNINGLRYELKTLLMARQYLVEQGIENNDRNASQVKKIDDGLKAVRQAIFEVERIVVNKKYKQFYAGALASKHLRKAMIEIKDGVKLTESVTSSAVGDSRNRMANKQNGQKLNSRNRARAKFNSRVDSERRKNAGEEQPDKNAVDKAKKAEVAGIAKDGKYEILYITLGDLIDLVLTNAAGKSSAALEFMNAEVLLGAFNAYDVGITGSKYNISLASLPISMEWFGQWFLENFSGGNPPRMKISLRLFINRLMNNLVAPLMNQAFADAGSRAKMNFSMATVTYPKSSALKPHEMLGGSIVTKNLKKLAESSKRPHSPSDPTISFFVVFATITDTGSLRGNLREDRENGIFHLTLGSDRGIVKTFSFSEKKMPQLRAMNIENSSKGSSLVLPQDVELTMVGNTFFRNGSLIYINGGFAMGEQLSRKLGIGGYYMVVKTENTINSSRFETRLTCMRLQGAGEK